MKRKWLVLPIATGILALALTGGAVFAQSGGDAGSAKDSMAAKVAEILGLDAGTVGDAMQQAAQELRSERTKEHLDQLVQDGVITQEQADAQQAWLDARPDGAFPGWGGGVQPFRGHGPRHRGFGRGEQQGSGFFQRGPGGASAPGAGLEGVAY